MKLFKTASILCLLTCAITSNAQIQRPIRWAYGERKINQNTYEIHLKAVLDKGWHIYAQKQPKNSVSVPTSFKFINRDFDVIGKTIEIGRLIKYHDVSSGLSANQYAGSVDFVQKIKIKDNSLDKITGNITFQVCTDHMCLQPDKVDFIIPLK